MSTDTPTCDAFFGTSKRVADVHTHPVDSNTIGILPSPSDLTSTLQDSFNAQSPQISCVTNHLTPLTECYQPKRVPDQYKLWTYDRALKLSTQKEDHSFFIDQARNDFHFSFYDPHNGKMVRSPKAHDVVKAAFGESKESLRKSLNELERPGFCVYIQAFTQPYNDKIQDECKKELKKRENWLGLPSIDL